MNLVLVFGGESSEHDVSIKSFLSAYEVIKNSSKLKKKLKYVFYITRDGKVVKTTANFSKCANNYFEEKANCDIFDMLRTISKEKLFLFSTIHGGYGEDGSLQGASKLFNIESNLGTTLSTSLSMSKYHLNNYLLNLKGMKIPKTTLLKSSKEFDFKKFKDTTIIVKPNALGSSLFTQKFECIKKNENKIKKLIKNILKFDEHALIQEFIKGDEYSVGILEAKANKTLPILKVEANDEFFSHESKYKKGIANNKIIPLKDETKLHKKLKKLSLKIFDELCFNSMARVDFLVRGEEIYFLEVNTLPGLKQSSIYPSMLKEYGISYEEFILQLMKNSKRKQSKETTLVYDVY